MAPVGDKSARNLLSSSTGRPRGLVSEDVDGRKVVKRRRFRLGCGFCRSSRLGTSESVYAFKNQPSATEEDEGLSFQSSPDFEAETESRIEDERRQSWIVQHLDDPSAIVERNLTDEQQPVRQNTSEDDTALVSSSAQQEEPRVASAPPESPSSDPCSTSSSASLQPSPQALRSARPTSFQSNTPEPERSSERSHVRRRKSQQKRRSKRSKHQQQSVEELQFYSQEDRLSDKSAIQYPGSPHHSRRQHSSSNPSIFPPSLTLNYEPPSIAHDHHRTTPCFPQLDVPSTQSEPLPAAGSSLDLPFPSTPICSHSESDLESGAPLPQFAEDSIATATPTSSRRGLFGFLLNPPRSSRPPPLPPFPSPLQPSENPVALSNDSAFHTPLKLQQVDDKDSSGGRFFTPRKWKSKKTDGKRNGTPTNSQDGSCRQKNIDGFSSFPPEILANGRELRPTAAAAPVSTRSTKSPRSLVAQVQQPSARSSTGRLPSLLTTLIHQGGQTPRVATPPIPQNKVLRGRPTLVLDLDETLVHSSFVEVPNYSFIIPVEIDGITHLIYVAKRPGVDQFLQAVSRCYEVVIFTASLAKYADPLMDQLDPQRYCVARLFREKCVLWNGQYVKDLSRMGRDIRKLVILDNSPNSYAFQPQNALPIESWFDDPADDELYQLIPILDALSK
ncbi:uncharacterized protein LOC129618166, partial [Condylostylus longicornis]|uniref:uncharacterized protein LOC129618166 n=1 Tax=Condylostylus longicornis TaxID=2530218 RepID=UPI00244DCC30